MASSMFEFPIPGELGYEGSGDAYTTDAFGNLVALFDESTLGELRDYKPRNDKFNQADPASPQEGGV